MNNNECKTNWHPMAEEISGISNFRSVKVPTIFSWHYGNPFRERKRGRERKENRKSNAKTKQ